MIGTEKPLIPPRFSLPDRTIEIFPDIPATPQPFPDVPVTRLTDVTFPESRRERGVKALFSLVPRRIMGFSVVGGSVMIGGIALLFILVHFLHVEEHLAYLIQAITSIETNFFLNRFLNWKERDGHLAPQWLKFNSTKPSTLPP